MNPIKLGYIPTENITTRVNICTQQYSLAQSTKTMLDRFSNQIPNEMYFFLLVYPSCVCIYMETINSTFPGTKTKRNERNISLPHVALNGKEEARSSTAARRRLTRTTYIRTYNCSDSINQITKAFHRKNELIKIKVDGYSSLFFRIEHV